VQSLLQKYAKEHEAIIYNGDNYVEAWVKEAAKRGLPNIRNCVDGIHAMIEPANAKVFIKHGVLPEKEVHARHEILLENYVKVINIEARTALQMARRQILPHVIKFAGDVAASANSCKAAGATPTAQLKLLKQVNADLAAMSGAIEALDAATAKAAAAGHADKKAAAYRDLVVPAMAELRAVVDGLEVIVGKCHWPLPTYGEMLFSR
jgi:glutamine synthetase